VQRYNYFANKQKNLGKKRPVAMRFTLFWGWRKKKRPVVAAFNPKSRIFAADSGSAGEDARVPQARQ